MSNGPNDTWELAAQLEALALMLRKAPKFIFTKKMGEITQKIPQISPLQDYNALKVKNLRELCKERGIKIPSRSRKADIVKLLEENDQGLTTLDKISVAFGNKGK